jgi:hypothetical protein
VTTVDVQGGAAFRAHMRRTRARLDEAVQRGVTKAVVIYAQAIGRELRRRTHPPGTVTPSPPGDPPALITGHLLRSVRVNRTRRIRAHVYEGSTGPTAVYARIHGKGGWTGAGHRTYLPPRPYVGPAVGAASARARATMRDEIRKATREV